MEKYQITFYAKENDNPIAAALAEGKDKNEAGDKAYAFLKEKYPTIMPGEYISSQSKSPLDVSRNPVELPVELVHGRLGE